MFLEVRILKELPVRFAEVRIVKELGGDGRLVAWIVMAAFRKEKSLTQRTKGAEDTETESRGNCLPEYWGEEPGEGLLATFTDKGVPACFSSLCRNRISIQENRMKSTE